MTIERKSFTAFEIKQAVDGPPGTVEAIVSASLNEDFGGDIVQVGAFTKFIGDLKSGVWPKNPTMLWNHSVELGLAAVTGKIVDMEELSPGDPRLPAGLAAKGLGGLKVKGLYNLKTQPGREAYEHVLAGDVSDWSFMYEVPVGGSEVDTKGRRLLKTIYPVYEVSNVLIGMNPETVTLGVKSMDLLTRIPEEWSPERKARREKLIAEVRDILEQLRGFSEDPVETKDDQLLMVGNEAFHQGAFNLAMTAITTLIQQELSEGGYELDDIRWLAGIGSDLRSWARSENWDAISDAQNAALNGLQTAAAPTPTAPSVSTPNLSLSNIPATDDNPPLDNPQRILDPYSLSASPEVEIKGEELALSSVDTAESNPEKVGEAFELALRDWFATVKFYEPSKTPEPLSVPERSDVVDGLTNWARRRLRH